MYRFYVLSILCFIAFLVPNINAANCGVTSVGFIPLIDMTSTDTYLGYSGFLYQGSNEVPPGHAVAASNWAGQIQPLDAAGFPSPSGKIGYTSIGMSNTNQEFAELIIRANADPLKRPEVVLMNGAQGGVPAEQMNNINDPFWTTNIPNKLSGAGLTAEQVQVAWLKQTNAGPTGPFPNWAQNLESQLRDICQHIHTTFPNIKIVYVSSRIYAGYASSSLNPEPYAYESGYSVKWLIDSQIDGDATLNYDPAQGTVRSGLLLWGPYPWADGTTPNGEGTFWICSDFKDDGTHPADPQGRIKVADLHLVQLHNDSTAFWYRTSGGGGGGTTGSGGGGQPGDQCYGYGASASLCLGDCECGGCGGDGCMPGDGCGPTRPEDQGKCSGSWNRGASCPACGGGGGSTTGSGQPATTGVPGESTTGSGQVACSTFDGNPPGCRASCWCGYCSPLGCTEGDPAGPDSGSCNGNWQFFGPC